MIKQCVPPNLIEYTEYRKYLQDYYSYKKAEGKKFSFRRFAQLAEVKSSNYLMLVMQGKRSLSTDTAKRVAKAMKLSVYEKDYFVCLVKMSEANEDNIDLFEKQRRISLRKIISKQIPKDKADFYESWYHNLVRELTFLNDFKPTGEWVSKKLRRLITPEEADNSIQLLVRLGLLKHVKDKLVACDTFVDSGSDDHLFENVNMTKIHKQNFSAWSKIIDDIDRKDRELGMINIPMSKNKIPELKKRIQSFQDEIIGWLQNEKDCDTLVQLGTFMLPISSEKDQ